MLAARPENGTRSTAFCRFARSLSAQSSLFRVGALLCILLYTKNTILRGRVVLASVGPTPPSLQAKQGCRVTRGVHSQPDSRRRPAWPVLRCCPVVAINRVVVVRTRALGFVHSSKHPPAGGARAPRSFLVRTPTCIFSIQARRTITRFVYFHVV